MMPMWLGLQHVLSDSVGLIYTPVIFSLICMYVTQNWLPPCVRIRLLQCYYTHRPLIRFDTMSIITIAFLYRV